VLSEEALIVAAVVGACALLVLGILELLWPTRRRHARRSSPDPRPSQTVTPPRPTQSILPRRLIDSPSSARPSGFVFPPPADYVPPPLPREEIRPIRPVGYVVPERPSEPEAPPPSAPTPAPPEPVVELIRWSEPAYEAPPPEEEPEPVEPEPIAYERIPLEPIAPEPIQLEPAAPAPVRSESQEPEPIEHVPVELEPSHPEPIASEPIEPEPIEFEPVRAQAEPLVPEPEPPFAEPEPSPAGLEPPPVASEPPEVEPAAPRFELVWAEFGPKPLEPGPELESEPPVDSDSWFKPEPRFELDLPSPAPPLFEAALAHEPEPSHELEQPHGPEPSPEPEQPRELERSHERELSREPEAYELESSEAPREAEPSRLQPNSAPDVAEPWLSEPPSGDVDAEPQPLEPEPLAIDTSLPPAEPSPPSTYEPEPESEPEPEPIANTSSPLVPDGPPRESGSPPQSAPPRELPPRRRRSKISPHARPHRVLRPGTHLRSYLKRWAGGGTPTSVESFTRPSALAGDPSPGEARLDRDTPLVERCFALYQEKRFDEVLSVGEPALAEMQGQPAAGPSREASALWSVVGLARQALGDHDGAHAALESSIDAAAEPERSTYRRHLGALGLAAAHARLAKAASQDADDRTAVIRAAIAWTERGLVAVPADAALIELRETAHEALWQAYEQAATVQLQRQEFSVARGTLHEALRDPKIPAARAAGFRGLLSGTFGGEIGQLTAQAILSMQEGRESDAVAALQRAEELLGTIPTDALAPARREEVDQRLWWGYAELGSRRLDAGDYEEALDPLIHALRFTSIGPERQAETRGAVVRALEGIAAVRALSIRRLAEAGSRDEAIVAAGELQGLVKHGLELGLEEDDLVAAFTRIRRLCEELGMDTRG
jgi:tetratricopeptide (TPR) repeat protein